MRAISQLLYKDLVDHTLEGQGRRKAGIMSQSLQRAKNGSRIKFKTYLSVFVGECEDDKCQK